MRNTSLAAGIFLMLALNSVQTNATNTSAVAEKGQTTGKAKHFSGAISNGMKGDSIRFDVSADGKTISNLAFNGWWRCSGKLEQQTGIGPDGSFQIINGQVDGKISEPPNGGSTAWHFDLKASIKDNKAAGTFRMNINNLGCDTYVLKFEAAAR